MKAAVDPASEVPLCLRCKSLGASGEEDGWGLELEGVGDGAGLGPLESGPRAQGGALRNPEIPLPRNLPASLRRSHQSDGREPGEAESLQPGRASEGQRVPGARRLVLVGAWWLLGPLSPGFFPSLPAVPAVPPEAGGWPGGISTCRPSAEAPKPELRTARGQGGGSPTAGSPR